MDRRAVAGEAVKRALLLAALIIVPGTALVLTVVAVVRYLRSRGQEQLTDETVRRIRSDAEMTARVAEVDEIPRGKRTVLDGPRRTTSLSPPWGDPR